MTEKNKHRTFIQHEISNSTNRCLSNSSGVLSVRCDCLRCMRSRSHTHTPTHLHLLSFWSFVAAISISSRRTYRYDAAIGLCSKLEYPVKPQCGWRTAVVVVDRIVELSSRWLFFRCPNRASCWWHCPHQRLSCSAHFILLLHLKYDQSTERYICFSDNDHVLQS